MRPGASEVVCDPTTEAVEDAEHDLDAVVAEDRGIIAEENNSQGGNDAVAEEELVEELDAEANGLVGGGAVSPDQPTEAEPDLLIPHHEEHQTPRRSPKARPSAAEAKDLQIALLTKKLNQAKKLNTELYSQLQRFSTGEIVLQVSALGDLTVLFAVANRAAVAAREPREGKTEANRGIDT